MLLLSMASSIPLGVPDLTIADWFGDGPLFLLGPILLPLACNYGSGLGRPLGLNSYRVCGIYLLFKS